MRDAPRPVRRIISGGQTGADRGALDAAIELGIEHGGHCPAGRRAEDGRIPERFRLVETTSADYAVRTERNVLDADATLLVTRGTPTGGSALTAALARKHDRPLLHLDLARESEPVAAVREWLAARAIGCLNVAGPRESSCPGIAQDVRALLVSALRGDRRVD
ncbi:MAG TPA: putative molybdenum carrier protein [Kofleriaceae bacterium]|nr:putative molybdenum carrier protein [Kofleriaceae bacterium]